MANTSLVQPIETLAGTQEVAEEESSNVIIKNSDLAKILGMKNPKLLTWLCRTKSEHYSVSKIPKRRGGFREINAPDKFMRLAQAKILTKILNHIESPDYTWAFEKNRSVPQMAKLHEGKAVVLSFDLKDFFPSITQKMIENMLRVEGVADGAAARTISELCTYKWYLPQGGITSPKVSNLIVKHTFGPAVYEFFNSRGYDVTVYADDITVSPKEGVVKSDAQIAEAVRSVKQLVQRHGGFSVNTLKTKVMRNGQRKMVCGVVVNETTNLPKKERLKLRAMVHNVCKNGVEHEAARYNPEGTEQEFLDHLQGRLGWFAQLNPEKGGALKAQLQNYLIVQGLNEEATPEEKEGV